jgi:crotonobetaine/carnitine-CoA ligase
MIPGILRDRVCSKGDSIFLRFRDQSISFGEIDERSNRAANLFREIGVRRGDKVCLMISNRPEFIELWFGLAKLGAAMVPLEASLMENTVSYIASHSDAVVLVMEDSASSAYGGRLGNFPKIRKKIWIGTVGGSPAGFLNYREAIGDFPRTPIGFPETDPSDVMSIVYTPGTTGLPKGVMLSQGNYCNSGKIWAEEVMQANSRDVLFTVLPLSQVLTQTLTVVASLVSGCSMVLEDGFEARTFFTAIRRYGATIFSYTSSMINHLMKLDAMPDDAANPARQAFGGALLGAMRRGFENRFGVEVVEGFHLTECGGMCLANFGESAKAGSIGKPLSSYEVKVVDEFDEELPTGLSGEILLRPKIPEAIFLGYYRDHERTAENMAKGWFHSGDRGYVDTDGDFFFLDRKADCIRHGGEVFSCNEVERIINVHPKVLESAATGVLLEMDDEDVRAFIVLRPGEFLSPEEIIQWCHERMATYLVPRYIEIVSELPKTDVGGMRKYELRKRPLRDERPHKNIAAI